MKCPHCGMNIRDNITECGYCGGKIAQRQDRAPPSRQAPAPGQAHRGDPVSREPPGMQDDEDSEEEGGLSRILQPGEQVLIGALNVSVKKFFFHAYMTNKRIFLVDTQEKKLKVTAKDIPRDTIAGSVLEFSENSDPVLVLSIRSGEDDVKTMKLVFAQNGMDRSADIDEWIALLQDDHPAKKAPKKQHAEVPVQKPVIPEEEQAEVPLRPAKPVQKHPELHPVRKPTKDLEKQPPVKRLLSMYKVPEEEPEPVPEPEARVPQPPRKQQIRQVPEPARRPVYAHDDEAPAHETEEPPVRKPEVQSAMKVAMKSAMRPLQQQPTKPVRRTIAVEPGPAAPSRRPVVQEPPAESQTQDTELPVTTPQFCHNCGKKLPHAANFCPGCGTKLSQSRTLPQNRHHATTTTDKRVARTDPPVHEHRAHPADEFDEDEGGETPVPAKPAIKKAPKGSEMTILHKFLRR